MKTRNTAHRWEWPQEYQLHVLKEKIQEKKPEPTKREPFVFFSNSFLSGDYGRPPPPGLPPPGLPPPGPPEGIQTEPLIILLQVNPDEQSSFDLQVFPVPSGIHILRPMRETHLVPLEQSESLLQVVGGCGRVLPVEHWPFRQLCPC